MIYRDQILTPFVNEEEPTPTEPTETEGEKGEEAE